MSTAEALHKAIEQKVPLKELSKLYCAYVLRENGNNKVHASKALDVDRRTLQRWFPVSKA